MTGVEELSYAVVVERGGATSGVVTDDQEFTAELLRQFESEVATLLVRDGISADAAGVARILGIFYGSDGVASPAARSFLADTGIRDLWNATFALDRARAVSDLVAPWLADSPSTIDLLAGDCRLTVELAKRTGTRILAVEHDGHYDDRVTHDLVDYRTLAAGCLELPEAETVFFGAVLHHEEHPEELRDLALTSGARRFVVIENSIDDRYGPDFHVLMDLFYNRSLNEFGGLCTRSHRAVRDWVDFLAPFGQLVHVEQMDAVPGLPFPYQLLVFER